MPKYVRYDGQLHSFPEDFTDGQITVALRGFSGQTPHGDAPTKEQDKPDFNPAATGIAKDTLSGMKDTVKSIPSTVGKAIGAVGDAQRVMVDTTGLGKPVERTEQAIDLFAQPNKTPLENLSYAGGKIAGAAKRTLKEWNPLQDVGGAIPGAGKGLPMRFMSNLLDSVDTGNQDPARESLVQQRQKYIDATKRVIEAKKRGLPVDPADRDLYAKAVTGGMPKAEIDPATGQIAEPMPERPGGMVESVVRGVAKAPAAIAETYIAPENAAIMGGTQGALAATKLIPNPVARMAAQMALGAGTTAYFAGDMAKGTGESIGRAAVGDFDQRAAENELPGQIANTAFMAHLASTGAKPLADSVEAARTKSLSGKSSALFEQSLRTANEKLEQNRKDGKGDYAGMNPNEIAAYSTSRRMARDTARDNGEAVPDDSLRNGATVDDLTQIAKQMFGDRPDMKVTVHETADSVPQNLRGKSDAAFSEVPALYDPKNNEVHFIRDRIGDAYQLALDAKHEKTHGTVDIAPEKVAGFAEEKMRREIVKLAEEGRLPGNEAQALLALDGPALAKAIAKANTGPDSPVKIAADEVMASLGEGFKAEPGRFQQGMATVANAIPGVTLTPMDAVALAAKQAKAKAGQFDPNRPINQIGEGPQTGFPGQAGLETGPPNPEAPMPGPSATPPPPAEPIVGKQVDIKGKPAKIVAEAPGGKLVVEDAKGKQSFYDPKAPPVTGDKVSIIDPQTGAPARGVVTNTSKELLAVKLENGETRAIEKKNARRLEPAAPEQPVAAAPVESPAPAPEAAAVPPAPAPAEAAAAATAPAPVEPAPAPVVEAAPPPDYAAKLRQVATAPTRDVRRRQLELAMQGETPPTRDPMADFLARKTGAVVIPNGAKMPRIQGARFIQIGDKRVVYWPGMESAKNPNVTNRDALQKPGGLERALEPRVPQRLTPKQEARAIDLIEEGATTPELDDFLAREQSKPVPGGEPQPRFSRNRDEYNFKQAKIGPDMSSPDEWRDFAEKQMEHFGVPRQRHEGVDSRGLSVHDAYGDKIIAYYDGDKLAASAKVDDKGNVLFLWGDKAGRRPQQSPFWREGEDSNARLGRWLALRDPERPYVKLQREMSERGVRRDGTESYTEKGARGVNDVLIPPEQVVNVIDGFRGGADRISARTGMDLAYIDKGIADLVGGKYDSPEAMDVVQWAHGEMARSYGKEILGTEEVQPGGTGRIRGRGGESPVGGVPQEPAAGTPADAVGDGGAGGEAAGVGQALFSRRDPSKHAAIVRPIMGDLVDISAAFLADKSSGIDSPEKLAERLTRGMGKQLSDEVAKEAKYIYEQSKLESAQRDKALVSVKNALEQKLRPAQELGVSKDQQTRELQQAVDYAREQTGTKGTKADAETQRAGITLLSQIGNKGVEDLVLTRAKQKGGTLSDAETVAAKLAMQDADANKSAMESPEAFARREAFFNAYRITGTEQGRSFRQRRWDVTAPAHERVKTALYDIMLDRKKKGGAEQLTLPQADKQLKQLKKFLKEEVGVENIEDIPVERLTDEAFMTDLVRTYSAKNAGLSMKARTWYLNSLVSAFKTHAANNIGNLTNFTVEYLVHRRAEAWLNKLIGNADGVLPSDLKGLGSQMLKAQLAAWKDAQNYLSTGKNNLEQSVYGADWVEQLRRQKRSFSGKAGTVIEAPTRMLGAEDAYFVSLIGHMEAMSAARQIARGEMGKEKIGTPEYEARVDELTSDYSSDAWRKGMDRAEYLTFKDETGRWIKSMLAFRRAHPNFTYVAPFLTTPANLIARGCEFVPGIGLVGRGVFRDIKEARGNPEARAELASKYSRLAAAQLIGIGASIALASTGAQLFKDDNDEPFITGSEPPSKFGRSELEARRRSLQPYTIRNPFDPKERISYRRIDPISTAIGLNVDLVGMALDYYKNRSVDRVIAQGKNAVLGQLVEKPFLKGIGDWVDWMRDEPGAQFPPLEVATGFYPRALQQIPAALGDRVMEQRKYGATSKQGGQPELPRLGKTMLYRATGISSIPGLGDLVEPKVNLYGDEVGKTGSAAYRMLLPFDRYGESGISPEGKAIDLRYLRGVEDTPEDTPPIPTEAGPRVLLGKQSYQMFPKDWAEYEGTRGKLLKDAAVQMGLVNDPNKPLSPEQIKMLNEISSFGGEAARAKMAPRYLGQR